jgi:uncharacterized membrane protein
MNLNIRFAASVAILQLVLIVLVYLNVSTARQVFGFLYLLLVPGYVFIKVLRLKDMETSEIIVYSVGSSIAMVMLAGLLVNTLLPIFGVDSPLSVLPLLVSISGVVLIMSLFVPKKQESEVIENEYKCSVPLAIALFSIPVLSIVGSLYISESQNSSVLLFAILLILIFVILGSFWKISQTFHALILSVCTFSLLYMTFFFTRFVQLWDEAEGFYVFRLTLINHYWNPNFVPALSIDIWKSNAMASTTILPTVFSDIANIDGTLLFQILFPSLLVLVPVILYQVYRTQTNKRASFIAAFLFITNSVALGWGNDIQKAAQLFYAVLFLVIFTPKLNSTQKYVLFTVFTIGLVLSHYSLAYIFTATLLFVYLVQRFVQKTIISRIKIGQVLIAFTMTFAWNIFISGGAAFNALRQSSNYVENELAINLFNLGERGGLVTQFFGVSQNTAGTILNEISVNIFRFSTILICLGFLSIILVRVHIKKSEVKFKEEFSIILYFNMGILVLNLILPGLAQTFLMQRFYQTTLMVLSPLFVLGSDLMITTLSGLRKTISKIKIQRISNYFMVTVLIALFLFQSGFIYEVAKTPSYSVSLSGYRIDKYTLYYGLGYTNAYDVAGAKWLVSTANYKQTPLYADINSIYGPLLSYGLISDNVTTELLNTTQHFAPQSLVYLDWVNVVDNVAAGSSYNWNITDITSALNTQNQVYTNGGCAIYSSPG